MSRLGTSLGNVLRLLGTGRMRRRGRFALIAKKVNAFEPEMQKLSDDDLRQRSRHLRRLAGEGTSLKRLLPESYALVREASVRVTGLRHYDVQVLAGVALHYGCISEMDTGEGKTLAATLPAYLNALTGEGVHVVTVNDYLAHRDAEINGPIFEMLGLSVSCVLNEHNDQDRYSAYRKDITYCTSKELGFDFLRDRLKVAAKPERKWGAMLGANNKGPQLVQRRHHFAIVDEADSILIDEARTPMIISASSGKSAKEMVERYLWCDQVAQQLTDYEHYRFDAVKRKVDLTQDGCRRVRSFEQPQAVRVQSMEDIYKGVERATQAHRGYIRDRDYVVTEENEVVIVDEFTGRLMPGREWQDGIHRAVEAKEGIEITSETGESARVTVQAYFKKYKRICGMTGTAASEAAEFKRMYSARFFRVHTNRPCCRLVMPDVVFATAEEKWAAVAKKIADIYAQGRPVLIGTRSIEQSETLSGLLHGLEVPHQVLNAKEHEKEAAIVAEAGGSGIVTVATNMAGRGTDIKLGEGVPKLGGLFVLGTEKHTARRVDRQLVGRCARQGDPGTAQFFISLEDDILEQITRGEKIEEKLEEAVATRRLERIRNWAANKSQRALQTRSLRNFFISAQKRLERKHYQQRRQLMEYEKIWDKMKKEMGLDPVLDWKEL